MNEILQKKNNRWVNEAYLISMALKDRNFRQRLKDDPRAVLTGELGVKLPPPVDVHVLEETKSEIFLVFPHPRHPLGRFNPKHLEEKTAKGYVRKLLEAQVINTAWGRGNKTLHHTPDKLVEHAIRILGMDRSYLPADFKVTLLHEDAHNLYLVIPYWGSKAYVDFDLTKLPDVTEADLNSPPED